MKTILIYGDSNTYGEAAFNTHRLGYEERWPNVLQRILDDSASEVTVIAEGLSSRIAGDYKQNDIYTNGLRHFETIFRSHAPVDVVIVALGTNDLQPKYHQSAQDIFENLLKYKQFTLDMQAAMPTVITSIVMYIAPLRTISRGDYFVGDQEVRNEVVNKLLMSGEVVIDAEGVMLSDDGVHISPDGHKTLAHMVYEKVKEYV